MKRAGTSRERGRDPDVSGERTNDAVKAEDQFHVGIVVDDVESTLTELSALFGYEWCDQFGGPVAVRLPSGDTVIELRFAYSRSTPRLEIIQSVPGTLWVPAPGSGIHHLGYWSDDVEAHAAALERRGLAREAAGIDADGVAYWTYHRGASGPRIELVSRALQTTLEQYWATGSFPGARSGGAES